MTRVVVPTVAGSAVHHLRDAIYSQEKQRLNYVVLRRYCYLEEIFLRN